MGVSKEYLVHRDLWRRKCDIYQCTMSMHGMVAGTKLSVESLSWYSSDKATDPSSAEQDHNTVMSFCDRVNNELEGPQIAVRLLAHKIQSPQEREAMHALRVNILLHSFYNYTIHKLFSCITEILKSKRCLLCYPTFSDCWGVRSKLRGSISPRNWKVPVSKWNYKSGFTKGMLRCYVG